jgi:hypothetical protein
MNVRQSGGAARKVFSVLCLVGLMAIGSAVARAGNSIPSVETILLRMAQARTDNRARLRPYTVIRHYKLLGREQQTNWSEVIA